MPQYQPELAQIAALIGDPVRARILLALLDGREMAASELASHAGSSAQSASGHLRKLVAGGLLTGRSEGRRRLFALSSGEIARAIETLASIAPAAPVTSLNQHSSMQRLRQARSCYDHLAGRLGVSLAERLVHRRRLMLRGDEFHVTREGCRFFAAFGIDVEALRSKPRSFARACVDWTERRPHLAGALGAALLERMLREQWLRRSAKDRSLSLTPGGRRGLNGVFGLEFAAEGE